jgi:tape measure domain-containing protein
MSDLVLGILVKGTDASGPAFASVNRAFAQTKVAQERVKLATDQAKLAYDRFIQTTTNVKSTQQQMQIAADNVAVALDRQKIAEANVAYAAERARAAQQQVASAMREEASAAQTQTSANERSNFSFTEMGARLSMIMMGIQSFISIVQGAARAVIGLAQAMTTDNAAMEQANIAFTHLLGSAQAAGTYLKQLWDFAARTPFNFPELEKDAQQMLAFGYAAKQVIPMLTDIGDAMSAMGQGQAVVAQIVHVFGQMHAAGQLYAQDMMQLVSTGIPVWKILADGMHTTVAHVRQLTQQGLIPADKAISLLLDGMHKLYGGSMQDQAKTFNGLMSTLQDNIQGAWRAFTGSAFDAAKQALVKLGDLVSSKDFQNFAKVLGQAIAPALRTIAADVGKVADRFRTWLGNKKNVHDYAELVKTLAQQIQKVSDKLGPAIDDFMAWNKQIGLINTDLKGTKGQINDVGDAISQMIPILFAFMKAGSFVILMQMKAWGLLFAFVKAGIDLMIASYNLVAGALGLPKLAQVSATVPEAGGYGGRSSGNFGGPGPGRPASNTGTSSGTGGTGGTGSGRGGSKHPASQTFTAADIQDMLNNAHRMHVKFNENLFKSLTASEKLKYLFDLVHGHMDKLAKLLSGTHKGLLDYVEYMLTHHSHKGKGGLIIDNGSSSTSGSIRSGGGSGGSGGFTINNHIQIYTNAKDGKELYQMVLRMLERDLRRSGNISSMLSGGKSQ